MPIEESHSHCCSRKCPAAARQANRAAYFFVLSEVANVAISPHSVESCDYKRTICLSQCSSSSFVGPGTNRHDQAQLEICHVRPAILQEPLLSSTIDHGMFDVPKTTMPPVIGRTEVRQMHSEKAAVSEQIQFARHNFDNHQALIRFADTKAAAVMTLVVFLCGVTIPVARDPVPKIRWPLGGGGISSGLYLLSYLALLWALGATLVLVAEVI